LISRTTKHSGAIKALQFNPFRPELLATAGAKGELYITDLNNAANPFRLGSSAARADDFEALDWNKKVPHILVTGSSGGFVTVWDVKAKKESLTLNNLGRKAVSAVAWDPDVPTKLMTAIPNDMDPLILMWDLRNANAPERTLRGHDQGVLSLSWCNQDSNILLSCGKDNRTICWNPHTGQALGDFPVVTNWTFQTQFHPHNPNLFATASFDGKISIQSLQNTSGAADQPATSSALDGEDFFNQTHSAPQGPSFSLSMAPKWYKRPVGASFGFGGKLVSFSADESGKSKISISTFSVDSSIGTATEEFDKSVQEGDLAKICQNKIASAKTDEEKADWTVIETLISGNSRRKLVEYLGFSDAPTEQTDETSEPTNGVAAPKDDASFFDNADTDEGNFLSNLAATKGTRTNNPFQIYPGTESEVDKDITKAIMMGSFEKAVDICLKEKRISDAFMIAICGGQKCIDKVQAAYFKQQSDSPSYLRLLASVVGKNLWDVVHNADLKDWKEVMATICTFADQEEFPDLCEALGDRLEEAISESSDASLRKDATFCFLAGSKLEKVIVNWTQELQETERAGLESAESDTSFSVHAFSLLSFIEKVTVFRKATGFQDMDLQKTSDWKLAPLYAKYTEFADIAAAHGKLDIAERYLDLLPASYEAAEVARNRVKQATRKVAPQTAQKQTTASVTGAQRGQRIVPTYNATPSIPTPASSTSQYAPQNSAQPSGPSYPNAPGAAGRSYTPMGYQQPQASAAPHQSFGYQPPTTGYAPSGYQPQGAPSAVPPPPRNFTSSPSVTPAAKQTNLSSWNDVPDFGPKPQPVSRRATPSVVPPFANAQASPPPNFAQQKATPPLPPPPKGPHRIASPASASGMNAPPPERPTSSTNAYMPPPPSQSQSFAAPPARTASPYQPPPSNAPPTNRYAPTPSAQQAPTPGGPPPTRQIAPPPNPYAQQPSPYQQAPPQQAAPPQKPAAPPMGPPRSGLPGGPPPGASSGPPQGPPRTTTSDSRPSTANSQRAAPAAAQKYPPGDRSHIPASSRPIFDILNADMQRVKGKAPEAFKAQVLDTEKRLNILFDHLNNEDLLKPDTIQDMLRLAQMLQGRQYPEAQSAFQDLMSKKSDEGTNWMVSTSNIS
jgi:protein transport protein SEC31